MEASPEPGTSKACVLSHTPHKNIQKLLIQSQFPDKKRKSENTSPKVLAEIYGDQKKNSQAFLAETLRRQ